MRIIASADKSAWNTVGDAALDEAARGEGKWGGAAADKTTVQLRGDVSFVDEASQTTVWRIVTKKARAKRGPRLQTQPQDGRCGHPLCRKICADGCGGCRRRRGRGEKGERNRRPPPQTRSLNCRRVCRFCGQTLVRKMEGSGDLSS